MLVDSHCHIDICERPVQEIVSKNVLIVAVGGNLKSNKQVLSYSELFPNVHASIGIDPNDVLNMTGKEIKENLEFIEKNKEKIVAIGEVGLDFYHIKKSADKEKQIKVFNQIIKLANKLNKPLSVHTRGAENKVLTMLKTAKVPIILHCFEGDAVLIQKAIKSGFYFGVPANFWTRKGFNKTAELAPLNKIITETDSPFLSPIGGENQPVNVSYALEKLSELKNESILKIETQIYQTTTKIFIKE